MGTGREIDDEKTSAFAACQAASERERVEGDIDVCVLLEQVSMKGCAAQRDALGGNSVRCKRLMHRCI